MTQYTINASDKMKQNVWATATHTVKIFGSDRPKKYWSKVFDPTF